MSTGLPRLADCRQCADPIRFVRLDAGSVIPVNPTPIPEGNVAARLTSGRLVGFVISRDRRPSVFDVYRFIPHAATCAALKAEAKPKPAPHPSLF